MEELKDDILKKFLAGELSEEESVEIYDWMNEEEENTRQLFRMEEIYHLGKFDQYTNEQRIERAERKLLEKIHQKEDAKKQKPKFRQWMRYAAVIAVIILSGSGIGYWFHSASINRNLVTQTVTDGTVIEVILPDGSKVWLNNGTTLSYPNEFSGKERIVSLEGEAYFEVVKNTQKPFIVETEAMKISVLGTTFNLKSHTNQYVAEATLVEGEIEVRGNNDEGMIVLSPGQRAELNKKNRRLTVKQVDAKLDGVWRNDLIPFEQANIFTITQTLERFYDVKIILSPDIPTDITYSGVLRKKNTVTSVLESLQHSIPIQYKIVGNNIFISPASK